MSNGLYPPILESTQPAFDCNVENYNIGFSLQNITSTGSIGHLQVRIVEQKTSISIVDTSIFPDGIIYLNWDDSRISKDPYSVSIPTGYLSKKWQDGALYKIQMRFGNNKYSFTNDDGDKFANWKQIQVNGNAFSEWSTVMVIKAISPPTVTIANGNVSKDNNSSTKFLEGTLTPLFLGSYTDNSGSEPLEKFKFDLYQDEELIESSDWIIYTDSCQYRFKQILINEESYQTILTTQTRNGYEDSTTYDFQVSVTYLDNEEKITLAAIGDAENGSIEVHLTTDLPLTGCYVLSRASENTNFGVYENIKYFNFFEQSATDLLIFTDYAVESGIKYKYAIQYENSQGLRSNLVTSNQIYVDYEYAFLYRNGLQLKLQFDQKMSSFKHSTLSSKQDTLGGKYPHLLRNGRAYYAEFPLNGLISFQMDDGQTFFNGNQYLGAEAIPADKFDTGRMRGRNEGNPAATFTIDNNITDNNVFIERKFREKVEAFLNDLTYKLYKSPTEGNIVIGLLNVSMSPKEELGRMLYSFSATAYEVLENTIDNLNSNGIIDIGSRDESVGDVYYESFGQIEGLYCYEDIERTVDSNGEEVINNVTLSSGETDIYQLVKQQEQVLVGDNKYELVVEEITGFRLEYYPEIDFEGLRCELESKQADLEQELRAQGLTTTEIETNVEWLSLKAEIDANEALKTACENTKKSLVKLLVNGKEIIAQVGRVYQIDYSITEFKLLQALYPIIINYTVKLRRKTNDSVGVIDRLETSKIWGQISGIFTKDQSVLRNYKYYYEDVDTLRIYSDQIAEYNNLGRPLVDNTNYNVYKMQNIYDIILEETRKQVEQIYERPDGFVLNADGDWVNNEIYYKFSHMTCIDIETDPFTDLYIGSKADGSDRFKVFVGPTGRYTLNPLENNIKYVSFIDDDDEPRGAYALINYKCTTTQAIMTSAAVATTDEEGSEEA